MSDEPDAGEASPDEATRRDDAESESETRNDAGTAAESDRGHDSNAGATVGEYDWEAFEREFFYEDGGPPTNWRGKPYSFDAEEYLGHDPADTPDRIGDAAETAAGLATYFESFLDPEETPVERGEYLWEHFRYEYYYDRSDDGVEHPRDDEGDVVAFDRAEWLGHDDFPASVFEGGFAVTDLSADFEEWLDPATTPVTKGEYYWEHFKYEYYYEDTSVTAPERPRDDDGEIERFDESEWLGFPEDDLEFLLADGAAKAEKLLEVEDERTLDVPEELDEDEFFSTVEGHTTVVNRYDLEKEVALPKKQHFREVDRYWVNKPFSFVVIFHSEKENETKYYAVEPYRTPIEDDLTEFLTGKLRASIKYSSDDVVVEAAEEERAGVIEREALELLARYDLYAENDGERAAQLRSALARYDETKETVTEFLDRIRVETDAAIEPLRESYRERMAERADDKPSKADTENAETEGAEPDSTPAACRGRAGPAAAAATQGGEPVGRPPVSPPGGAGGGRAPAAARRDRGRRAGRRGRRSSR
ncbi:hypothetical protein [Halorussus amylolyticus]|uniref:hypothetical protein n=1 Tax=Halorussus amylolyticus TaxID=1126242 RepID=UPI00138F1023